MKKLTPFEAVKKLLPIFLFFFLFFPLTSGDKANFLNLGFSPNGHYFMFGQFGYTPESSSNYAGIHLIDVRDNTFVPGGSYRKTFILPNNPTQKPIAGFLKLLETTAPRRNRYRIDYLIQGTPIYINLGKEKDSKNLEFRNYNDGKFYQISLLQQVEGKVPRIRSSFFIKLTVKGKTNERTYTIGRPHYKRTKIVDYDIKQILLGPQNKTILFVISKEDYQKNIRYMVESRPLS